MKRIRSQVKLIDERWPFLWTREREQESGMNLDAIHTYSGSVV